jgi:hypothetical protein
MCMCACACACACDGQAAKEPMNATPVPSWYATVLRPLLLAGQQAAAAAAATTTAKATRSAKL